MCGILGIVARSPVNQLLYDGLLLLQHRGQDAAGIVTAERNSFHMHKAPGMVRDVFRTRNMRSLSGNIGIAHCRYPTAGSAFSSAEAQPRISNPFTRGAKWSNSSANAARSPERAMAAIKALASNKASNRSPCAADTAHIF